MTHLALILVATALTALGAFVWRANSGARTNKLFALQTLLATMWTVGVAGLHTGFNLELWARWTFLVSSFIPPCSLAFIEAYPIPGVRLPRGVLRAALISGSGFALFAVCTDWIVYDTRMSAGLLVRESGPLHLVFVAYFVLMYCVALTHLFTKWRNARGLGRLQIQYLGAGILTGAAGGIAMNLAVPLVTGSSSYSWIGPLFNLGFLALVAHAIIRHRLMDLRLVIHRSLTVAVAIALSLAPVAVLLSVLWPRMLARLHSDEVFVLLFASATVALLIPPTRDTTRRMLDRYLYRSRANFRSTVREASTILTKVLDFRRLLAFLADTITKCIEAEAAAVYLLNGSRFSRAIVAKRHEASHFAAPDDLPAEIAEGLSRIKDALLEEECIRTVTTSNTALAHFLERSNWSLVLPVISDNGVIALIALGPKLSGDAFYPQDLDLLMTLANQAGIAIKNARLYAQVVLANEYIENIVATIESGVVAVTSAGEIAMFNRAAERLTGRSAQQVKGQAVGVLDPRLSEPLLATLSDGQPRTAPEIELTGDGVARPIMCRTSPLRDPDGVVLGAVSIFSDLTPLKELEVERRRAERLAYFELLASGIAHEIKNPLVAIKTFTQLVPRRHEQPDFIEQFTRVVGHEIERMEGILGRLGALSRPGRRPLYPVDVRAPLSEAVEAMQAAFDEKRIRIVAAVGDRAGIVVGHHAELEQLFLNLLMNAHEATPPEGAVHVEVLVGTDRVTVRVADTGPGIAPELVERVFDPFFSTKQRGSGLGLAICAGIAQTHGARLQAANGPHGGALLTVDFPAATAQAARVDA